MYAIRSYYDLAGNPRVVRVMPNTPALIGAGVTGLYALPSVSEAERLGAERISYNFV